MIADLCGCAKATGDIVSGGTTANILALKAARDGAVKKNPNVVMPATAHPSLLKGCQFLAMEARRIACNEKTYRAVPEKMASAVDDNTVAIVGCFGDPGNGAVDPIPELAEIAVKNGIHMHVDAAWAGFIMPFLSDLGYLDIPDWNFRVEGVSSITVDPHKMLLCPMPAGGILYRNESIRECAGFTLGNYSTHTLVGSRSGASIVCLWALLKTTGYEGYLRNAEKLMQTTHELVRQVCTIPGMTKEIEPQMNLVTFRTEVDPVLLSEQMAERGWQGMSPRKDPPTFRCIVLPHMENRIPQFTADLKEVNASLMR